MKRIPANTSPCPLCGYHAPETPCPHCGGTARLASLRRPLRGPWSGIPEGLLAVPMGLLLLATTRGTKRWLLPPFVVTSTVLIVVLWWLFAWLGGLVDSVLPGEITLGDGRWDWLEARSDRWDWLKASVAALIAAGEWGVNSAYGLITARPVRWLGYFLLGSLVAWYAFSIVYEALAGPFLDEVQGRLEARWFGADPRSRIERPNDIPTERVLRRSLQAGALTLVVLALGIWAPFAPLWLALLVLPLPALVVARLDVEFGQWLVWILRVEGRATLVSLQAAVLTGVLLLVALPLYFVPFGIGYVLFAVVTGFATAVGLLDIPFERRGVPLGRRLAFLGRHSLVLVAFGAVAGALLAIPVAGPLLMVPAASAGGLWLMCRLDKSRLAPGHGSGGPPAPDPPAR